MNWSQNTSLMVALRQFIMEFYENEVHYNFKLEDRKTKEIYWTQVDKDTIEVHVTYHRRVVYTFNYELERIS